MSKNEQSGKEEAKIYIVDHEEDTLPPRTDPLPSSLPFEDPEKKPACRKKLPGKSLQEYQALLEHDSEMNPLKRFVLNLRESFEYPCRGDGCFLLIGGGLSYAAIIVLAFLVNAGFAIPLHLILTAYVFAYLSKVVRSSGHGEAELPDWPDMSDTYDEFLLPLILAAASILISFTPPMIVEVLGWDSKSTLFRLLYIFSAVYFPMQFLAVSMTQSPRALNPLFVLQAILRVPGRYLLLVLSLALAMASSYLTLAVVFTSVPVLGNIVFHLFALYFLFAYSRLLGRFYYFNKGKLGWFRT